MAAVTAPPVGPGDLEALLRCLLPTAMTPPPRPVPTEMEILLERLLSGAPAPTLTPPPRTGRRLTQQSNRQPVDVVKVSALMIDMIPDPVGSPVPTGIAGANSSTNNNPPLVHQMASEDSLSMEEEVVADLNFCGSVVGGPTSTFLKNTGLIVDLAGDVIVGVSSPADLAGDVTVGVSSLADLAGDVAVGVSSLADLVGVVPSAVAEVASSVNIAEVASSADLARNVTVGVILSAVTEVASLVNIAEVASSADLAEVASSADLC